jgi:hypothetical protein
MAHTKDTKVKEFTLGRRTKAVDFANIYHRFGIWSHHEVVGVSNLDVWGIISIWTVHKHVEGSSFWYMLMASPVTTPLCLDPASPVVGPMLAKTFPTLGSMSPTCSCPLAHVHLFSQLSP